MNQSRWATLAVAWVATSLVVGVALAGAGLAWGKRGALQSRRGWKLVPAMVAARDLPEGTVLEVPDLVIQDVPEELVTASVVRPGGTATVSGQKLQVAMMKGDLVLASHLKKRPVAAACATDARAMAKSLDLDDPQVSAFLDELQTAVDAQQPKEAP